MAWSAIFNTVFAFLEWRHTGRAASERSGGLRALHALLHKLTAVVVSCPVIHAMTPLGWGDTLQTNLGLTLVYTVYGYLFHLGVDRLRPMRTSETVSMR
jgi:uncharacterized membrane protein